MAELLNEAQKLHDRLSKFKILGFFLRFRLYAIVEDWGEHLFDRPMIVGFEVYTWRNILIAKFNFGSHHGSPHIEIYDSEWKTNFLQIVNEEGWMPLVRDTIL